MDFKDGSNIKYLNRMAVRYSTEKKYQMDIGLDFYGSFFSNKRAIIKSSISNWNEPHNDEVISPEGIKEILNKVIRYCEKNKINYLVVD